MEKHFAGRSFTFVKCLSNQAYEAKCLLAELISRHPGRGLDIQALLSPLSQRVEMCSW